LKKTLFFLALLCVCLLSVNAQEYRDALELYRNGSYDEAVEVCLQELEAMPRNMDSYVVLGWSLLKLKRYDEALQYGEEAHSITPSDYRVIEILGETHFYLGNNQESLKNLEEYTVLAPTGDRIDFVYYLMGEIFIRLGEYNHADIAFSTALYHSPNSANWWARLGYAREMIKDYTWSLDAYNKALTLNASHSEARRGIERVTAQMESG
jgi:tetratricopeptide (TPR) repeat protein